MRLRLVIPGLTEADAWHFADLAGLDVRVVGEGALGAGPQLDRLGCNTRGQG